MDSNEFSITLPARCGSVTRVIDEVNSFAVSVGISKDTMDMIDVAIDEVCANIVNYAYSAMPEPGSFTVKVSGDNSCLTLVFSDSGVPFNPLEVREPEFGSEPSEGGLGIFFCKNIMTGLSYRHAGGMNELTMFKRI